MINKTIKNFCLGMLFLFALSANLKAQTTSKAKLREYRNNPVWIQMMNDPNSNYNEAVIAFEEFWRGKPEPEEVMRGESEGEDGEEHEERSFLSKIFKSESREREEILRYAEDYKKFTFWRQKNAAYVKPDGTVMTAEEKQILVEQELINRQTNR